MCGIAGLLGPGPVDDGRLRATIDAMAKRGPDGSGAYQDRIGSENLTLLHTRLSIVDLGETSAQPFSRNDLTLIYNGEVYNHIELRLELAGLGVTFSTQGDTELVLEAYRYWGVEAFSRLEGMWALALHDARRDELILCRDRFGEKPLYIWYEDGRLSFGSEVKALALLTGRKPGVNTRHLQRYLVNGYKSLYASGESFFAGVSEFPAGCFAVLKGAGLPDPKAYWTLRFEPDRKMSLDDALNGARDLVRDAVSYRLRADVPVALRLSGGIDSNAIAGTALSTLGAELHSFSVIDDDPRYDETENILKSVSYFDCPNTLVRIPREGFVEWLTSLVSYFDGPLMTISYYLHALVSEAIHDAGYKVSLGGTAADEIFTGYYDHYLFWLATQSQRPDFPALIEGWRQSYGQFVRNPFLQDPEAFVKNPNGRDHIFLGAEGFAAFLVDPFAEAHTERRYCDDLLRNRMMNELLVETVPVMLHEDDLASMAYSVENRAPFLHTPLVEFLFTVPTEYLIQEGLPKFLLRAVGDGIAPDDVMKNPRKQGINAPVGHFLDFQDPELRDWILLPSPLFDIVRRDRFEEMISSQISLNSQSKFVFSCLATKIFLEQQEQGGVDL